MKYSRERVQPSSKGDNCNCTEIGKSRIVWNPGIQILEIFQGKVVLNKAVGQTRELKKYIDAQDPPQAYVIDVWSSLWKVLHGSNMI